MTFTPDPCCCIQRIATEYKLFFYNANVANCYIPGMHASLKGWDNAVFLQVIIFFSFDGFYRIVYKFQTSVFVFVIILPADHNFIADVLIDVSPVSKDRFSNIRKKSWSILKYFSCPIFSAIVVESLISRKRNILFSFLGL